MKEEDLKKQRDDLIGISESMELYTKGELGKPELISKLQYFSSSLAYIARNGYNYLSKVATYYSNKPGRLNYNTVFFKFIAPKETIEEYTYSDLFSLGVKIMDFGDSEFTPNLLDPDQVRRIFYLTEKYYKGGYEAFNLHLAVKITS